MEYCTFSQDTVMIPSVLGMARSSLRTGLLSNSHEESNIQGLEYWVVSWVHQPFTKPWTKSQYTAGDNLTPFMDFLSSHGLFSYGSCYLHILIHTHNYHQVFVHLLVLTVYLGYTM